MASSQTPFFLATGAFAVTAHPSPRRIEAQRALRDAITNSDWVAEDRARRALASILIESDEPALAAHHLAQIGATKQIDTLGKSLTLEFIDITGSSQSTV